MHRAGRKQMYHHREGTSMLGRDFFFFKSDLTCFLLNLDKNVQIWREKHGGYSQILKGSHFRSKKVSVTEKDSFYNYIMLA